MNGFTQARMTNNIDKHITVSVVKEKKKWDTEIKNLDSYDFYHTYDYHQLAKQKNESAILFVYELNELTIALPLLIRSIKETSYFDATSVYGYAGPISKNIPDDFDSSNFNQKLLEFLKSNNIIAVFSRLNPFIKNQESIIGTLGTIESIGSVVNIDLTKDIDTQKTSYSKTTKRYLNKTKKICSVITSDKEEDIITFIDLYHENMKRVNAKDSYFFDKEYVYKILNSDAYNAEVLFAVMNETKEIISAAIMVKTNEKIIQYHISGTRTKHLNLTPIRLLIDEMRIKGTKENYTYFNLGGGLGSQEDTLFQFKASFSKDFKDFKIWKHIIDTDIYDELVEKNIALKDIDKNNVSFFPLYRYE